MKSVNGMETGKEDDDDGDGAAPFPELCTPQRVFTMDQVLDDDRHARFAIPDNDDDEEPCSSKNDAEGRAKKKEMIKQKTFTKSKNFLADVFGKEKSIALNMRISIKQQSGNDTSQRSVFEQDCEPERDVIRFQSKLGQFIILCRIVSATFTTIFAFFMVGFRGQYKWLHSEGVIFDIASCVVFLMTQWLQFHVTQCDLNRGREFCCKESIREKLLSSRAFKWQGYCSIPFTSIFLLIYGFNTNPRTDIPWYVDLIVIGAATIPKAPLLIQTHPSMMWIRYDTRIGFFRLFSGALIMAHVFGCFLNMARWHSGSIQTALEAQIPDVENRTTASWYLVSLREGIFLIAAKDPVTTRNGEMYCLILIGPIAAFFFAYIFGSITVLVTQTLALQAQHTLHMASIGSAMESLGLPTMLKYRITQYHHFINLHHDPVAYNALFGSLSSNLILETRLFLFRQLFVHAEYFVDADADLIRQLVMQLEECTYSPGDIIILVGNTGDTMFFIVKGKCAVLNAECDVVATLRAGDHFGEIALLFEMKRLATVRADTYCVLGKLQKTQFENIIQHFPDERERIVALASRRMSNTTNPAAAAEAASKLSVEKAERSNGGSLISRISTKLTKSASNMSANLRVSSINPDPRNTPDSSGERKSVSALSRRSSIGSGMKRASRVSGIDNRIKQSIYEETSDLKKLVRPSMLVEAPAGSMTKPLESGAAQAEAAERRRSTEITSGLQMGLDNKLVNRIQELNDSIQFLSEQVEVIASKQVSMESSLDALLSATSKGNHLLLAHSAPKYIPPNNDGGRETPSEPPASAP